jgi:hypothetical protein
LVIAARSYVLGIDPGQVNDPTALALLELDHLRRPVYLLRALHRFPLGTPYTELPSALARRLLQPPLGGHTSLAIDATGVGAPVIDHFRQELPKLRLYAITITAGSSVTGNGSNPHVPKRDLIGTSSVILEQRRLRIAANMHDTDPLRDELLAYRRTTSERGYDSYAAAAGSHDDLVLALSLALWTAEHRPSTRPQRRYSRIPRGRLPTATEMDRIREQRRHFSP